jgi:hypothetical protein
MAIATARVAATAHPHAYAICAAAWAVPGAGHLWLGRRQKGLTFLPLVALAAFADLGIGVPYFLAKALSLGGGRVIAISYEYGNAFLIVAGLLNMLVVLDAYDIAQGRK